MAKCSDKMRQTSGTPTPREGGRTLHRFITFVFSASCQSKGGEGGVRLSKHCHRKGCHNGARLVARRLPPPPPLGTLRYTITCLRSCYSFPLHSVKPSSCPFILGFAVTAHSTLRLERPCLLDMKWSAKRTQPCLGA
eukprot:1653103-Amphidinium_carterae.1